METFLALLLTLLSALASLFSPTPVSHSLPSPSAAVPVQAQIVLRDNQPTTTLKKAPFKTPAKAPVPMAPKNVAAIATMTPVTQAALPAPIVEPAPMPAPAPEPEPTQPGGSFVSLSETEIFSRMNAERAANNLPLLVWDVTLSNLSREHSADMIANKYFSHTDEDGCGSSCRANRVSYLWQAIGENIYMSSGYKVTPQEEADMVVDGWMNSPGHRANILGNQYTRAGVGVAILDESVYVTAMYSKPR